MRPILDQHGAVSARVPGDKREAGFMDEKMMEGDEGHQG